MRKPSKSTILTILAMAIFFSGILIGRYFTITSAQLTHVTSTGYEITYGGEIHYYYGY